MNHEIDHLDPGFDPRIADWLEHDPDQAPSNVLVGVLAAASRRRTRARKDRLVEHPDDASRVDGSCRGGDRIGDRWPARLRGRHIVILRRAGPGRARPADAGEHVDARRGCRADDPARLARR